LNGGQAGITNSKRDDTRLSWRRTATAAVHAGCSGHAHAAKIMQHAQGCKLQWAQVVLAGLDLAALGGEVREDSRQTLVNSQASLQRDVPALRVYNLDWGGSKSVRGNNSRNIVFDMTYRSRRNEVRMRAQAGKWFEGVRLCSPRQTRDGPAPSYPRRPRTASVPEPTGALRTRGRLSSAGDRPGKGPGVNRPMKDVTEGVIARRAYSIMTSSFPCKASDTACAGRGAKPP
jgi:hypothetical protein